MALEKDYNLELALDPISLFLIRKSKRVKWMKNHTAVKPAELIMRSCFAPTRSMNCFRISDVAHIPAIHVEDGGVGFQNYEAFSMR